MDSDDLDMATKKDVGYKKHQRVLQTLMEDNRPDLVSGLSFSGNLYTLLRAKGLITMKVEQNCKGVGSSEEDQAEKLLDLVCQWSDENTDKFCAVLRDCQPTQGHLVDLYIDPKNCPASPDATLSQASTQETRLTINKFYKMSKPKMGKALIVNNWKFDKDGEPRIGSQNDMTKLKNLLHTLQFEVKLMENLTKEALSDALMTFRESKDHLESNCAFVCMMTHGDDREGLLCKDGSYYPWKEFCKCLSTVPALDGKPKLILFQACRGSRYDFGRGAQTDHAVSGAKTDAVIEVPLPNKTWLPTTSDVFIMFPTVEGYLSYRDPNVGSYFIQLFCDVFLENYESDHLVSMYTEVKRKVAEVDIILDPANVGQVVEAVGTPPGTVKVKQAAEAVDTLRMKMRFKLDKPSPESNLHRECSTSENIAVQSTQPQSDGQPAKRLSREVENLSISTDQASTSSDDDDTSFLRAQMMEKREIVIAGIKNYDLFSSMTKRRIITPVQEQKWKAVTSENRKYKELLDYMEGANQKQIDRFWKILNDIEQNEN